MISCDGWQHTRSIARNKENNPKIQCKYSFFSETDLGHNIFKKSFLYFYKIWKILHLQNDNNLVIQKMEVLWYKNYFLRFHNKFKDLKKIKYLKIYEINPHLLTTQLKNRMLPKPYTFLARVLSQGSTIWLQSYTVTPNL